MLDARLNNNQLLSACIKKGKDFFNVMFKLLFTLQMTFKHLKIYKENACFKHWTLCCSNAC